MRNGEGYHIATIGVDKVAANPANILQLAVVVVVGSIPHQQAIQEYLVQLRSPAINENGRHADRDACWRSAVRESNQEEWGIESKEIGSQCCQRVELSRPQSGSGVGFHKKRKREERTLVWRKRRVGFEDACVGAQNLVTT